MLWLIDALGPWFWIAGFVGAMALWFSVYWYGDWLERPSPGDLPYRWGRVAWNAKEAKAERSAWFAAALMATLFYFYLLGWTAIFA